MQLDSCLWLQVLDKGPKQRTHQEYLGKIQYSSFVVLFQKFVSFRKINRNQRNPSDYSFGDIFRILSEIVKLKQGTVTPGILMAANGFISMASQTCLLKRNSLSDHKLPSHWSTAALAHCLMSQSSPAVCSPYRWLGQSKGRRNVTHVHFL